MASLVESSLVENLNNLTVQDTKPIEFNSEELAAFQSVKDGLLKKGIDSKQVRDREVAVVTMLSKCRVEKAIEKYVQFIDTIGEFDINCDTLYSGFDVIEEKLRANYQVCGQDNGGRSIMWIGSSTPTEISEEQITVHSGVLYWMAVHSDLHTLREGCTFVIDTSKQNGVPKVGNERKMQKTWQSLPLRPQNLFIVGASFLKRIFINALIAFASIFSNSKVLARIRFVEMPEVRTEVPSKSMPEEYGGEHRQSVPDWVQTRLSTWNDFKIGVSATEEETKKISSTEDNDKDVITF